MTDPAEAAARPGVILWFKMPRGLSIAFGVGMALISGVMLAVSLLPLVLSLRPWLWVYGLVVIGLGMTSACFLPVCIPLLLFWMKPETKAYYGG